MFSRRGFIAGSCVTLADLKSSLAIPPENRTHKQRIMQLVAR